MLCCVLTFSDSGWISSIFATVAPSSVVLNSFWANFELVTMFVTNVQALVATPATSACVDSAGTAHCKTWDSAAASFSHCDFLNSDAAA